MLRVTEADMDQVKHRLLCQFVFMGIGEVKDNTLREP